eukprot:gene909-2572_t
MSAEKKAEAFVKSAENALKATTGFKSMFADKEGKRSEAAASYVDAANQYKIAQKCVSARPLACTAPDSHYSRAVHQAQHSMPEPLLPGVLRRLRLTALQPTAPPSPPCCTWPCRPFRPLELIAFHRRDSVAKSLAVSLLPCTVPGHRPADSWACLCTILPYPLVDRAADCYEKAVPCCDANGEDSDSATHLLNVCMHRPWHAPRGTACAMPTSPPSTVPAPSGCGGLSGAVPLGPAAPACRPPFGGRFLVAFCPVALLWCPTDSSYAVCPHVLPGDAAQATLRGYLP